MSPSTNNLKNGAASASATFHCMSHEFDKAADALLNGAASPKNPYRLSVRMASVALALVKDGGHISAWAAVTQMARNLPGVNMAVIDNAKKRANHLLQNEIRAGNAAWDKFCMSAIYSKRERKHIENAICFASLILIATLDEAQALVRLLREKDDAY